MVRDLEITWDLTALALHNKCDCLIREDKPMRKQLLIKPPREAGDNCIKGFGIQATLGVRYIALAVEDEVSQTLCLPWLVLVNLCDLRIAGLDEAVHKII